MKTFHIYKPKKFLKPSEHFQFQAKFVSYPKKKYATINFMNDVNW